MTKDTVINTDFVMCKIGNHIRRLLLFASTHVQSITTRYTYTIEDKNAKNDVTVLVGSIVYFISDGDSDTPFTLHAYYFYKLT